MTTTTDLQARLTRAFASSPDPAAWSVRSLAAAAHCGKSTAAKFLRQHRTGGSTTPPPATPVTSLDPQTVTTAVGLAERRLAEVRLELTTTYTALTALGGVQVAGLGLLAATLPTNPDPARGGLWVASILTLLAGLLLTGRVLVPRFGPRRDPGVRDGLWFGAARHWPPEELAYHYYLLSDRPERLLAALGRQVQRNSHLVWAKKRTLARSLLATALAGGLYTLAVLTDLVAKVGG